MRHSNRFVTALLCALLLLPFVVHLTAAPQTDQKAELSGVFKLVSLDGHDLPYTVTFNGQQGPTVVSGSLTFNKDGSCASSISFKSPNGDPVARDVRCTFKKDGADHTLTWEGAGQTKVSIVKDGITMNNEGMIFLYKK